jgi:hypothetical protein
MSYAAVLEALARIHVDLHFRAAFLRDPEAALAGLGLSEAARRALAGLDPAGLDRIARIADHHRITRVAEHLSWLDRGKRPDLEAHLARYMAAVPPRLLNREEAIAFCEHLEAAHPPSPPYLPDLARFERLRIAIAWGLDGAAPCVERFSYPVLELLRALEAPGWPAAAPRPAWVELKKVPFLPAVIARERPEAPLSVSAPPGRAPGAAA